MTVILFLNLKGGVAKTTNAVATAECLANQGFKTLLIDADHQCMASELALGERRLLQVERKRMTLHDLLASMLDDEFEIENTSNFIVNKVSNIGDGLENLDLLPCSFRIDDFQTNMAKARRGYHSPDEFVSMLSSRRSRLRTWLNKNYDFTIVDCPPSLPMQIKFFLVAGEYFIVPSVPDRLSVRGSLYLLDRLKNLGIKRLESLGVLWSLYRKQNAMHGRMIQHVAEGIHPYDQLPKPFETVIPNSAAIADSTEPERNPPSFSQKYSPQFSKLYRDLCFEIIQRTNWQDTGRIERRSSSEPVINQLG